MSAADIARLDDPLSVVEQRIATLRAARERARSESGRIAYALDEALVANDEATAKATVIPPGWNEHIATLAELNKKPKGAS